MIDNVSLDYLKIFHSVAKNQNLTRASEGLHISQPAITQTIKKLEDVFGIKLFIRTKRGVILTKEGEGLFNLTNNLELNIKNIDKYLSSVNGYDSGEIIVGCGGNIAKKVIVPAFKVFHKKYPNVKLIQHENTQDEMLNMLKLGKIDLCVSQKCDCDEDLCFTHLFNEGHVFVCTKEYLLSKADVDYEYIVQAKGSYSRKIFDNYLAENAKICVENAGYSLSKTLCLNDVGVAILPSYFVEDELKNGTLVEVHKELNMPVVEYGYYVNSGYITKILKEFIKYL